MSSFMHTTGELAPLIEQWLETSDAFSAWFRRVPKRVYHDDKSLSMLEATESEYNEVKAAWSAFEAERTPASDARLRAALEKARDTMSFLMREHEVA